MKWESEKEIFAESFNRQLQAILGSFIVDSFVKFSLALPSNHRFSYTDSEFLHNELNHSLKKFYPFGVKIVYITPNSNDDHFIEIGVLVTFPRFQK